MHGIILILSCIDTLLISSTFANLITDNYHIEINTKYIIFVTKKYRKLPLINKIAEYIDFRLFCDKVENC